MWWSFTWESLTLPLQRFFEEAIEFVEKNTRVVVHCGAGASRSPTIVMAWMMRTQRHSLRQSFDLVKAIRPFVQPNEGFMQQLIDYEYELFGSNSVSLTDFDYGSD